MALHRRPNAQHTASCSDAAATPPLGCGEVLLNLWDYLDGRCSSDLADRIEAHASSCARCGGLRESQDRLLDSLAELREASPAPQRVHGRVRKALEAERRRNDAR